MLGSSLSLEDFFFLILKYKNLMIFHKNITVRYLLFFIFLKLEILEEKKSIPTIFLPRVSKVIGKRLFFEK